MKRDPEKFKRVIPNAVVILLKSVALGILLLLCLTYIVSAGYAM